MRGIWKLPNDLGVYLPKIWDKSSCKNFLDYCKVDLIKLVTSYLENIYGYWKRYLQSVFSLPHLISSTLLWDKWIVLTLLKHSEMEAQNLDNYPNLSNLNVLGLGLCLMLKWHLMPSFWKHFCVHIFLRAENQYV